MIWHNECRTVSGISLPTIAIFYSESFRDCFEFIEFSIAFGVGLDILYAFIFAGLNSLFQFEPQH